MAAAGEGSDNPVVAEVDSVVAEVESVLAAVNPMGAEVASVVAEVNPVVTEVASVVTEVNPVATEVAPVVTEASSGEGTRPILRCVLPYLARGNTPPPKQRPTAQQQLSSHSAFDASGKAHAPGGRSPYPAKGGPPPKAAPQWAIDGLNRGEVLCAPPTKAFPKHLQHHGGGGGNGGSGGEQR